MPLDEFFAGPGRTVLAPGEIVESIDLPLPTERTGGAFERLTRRHGVDLAIVNLCCVVRESGDVRFAFGAVGPRPFVVASRRRCAARRRAGVTRSPISDLRGERRIPHRHAGRSRAARAEDATMRLQQSRERHGARSPRDGT